MCFMIREYCDTRTSHAQKHDALKMICRNLCLNSRPVSHIAWCPDGEKMTIAYCNLEFQVSTNTLSRSQKIVQVLFEAVVDK